jgi:hypothetical protein
MAKKTNIKRKRTAKKTKLKGSLTEMQRHLNLL